jgi:hypothetical protein
MSSVDIVDVTLDGQDVVAGCEHDETLGRQDFRRQTTLMTLAPHWRSMTNDPHERKRKRKRKT